MLTHKTRLKLKSRLANHAWFEKKLKVPRLKLFRRYIFFRDGTSIKHFSSARIQYSVKNYSSRKFSRDESKVIDVYELETVGYFFVWMFLINDEYCSIYN